VINQRALTVTASTDTKTYDGTTSSAAGGRRSARLQTGDHDDDVRAEALRTATRATGKTLKRDGGGERRQTAGITTRWTFVADTTGVIKPAGR